MTKNLKRTLIFLVVSTLASAWLYTQTSAKVENVLTSREWQSRMVTRLFIESDSEQDEVIGPLRKATIDSNVKYLPNGTYLRLSHINLYTGTHEKNTSSTINVSENGAWELSGNYLLIEPKEFKDISSNQGADFTNKQLKVITQIFKMDAQQSRRVEIINAKALLMTSLDHGSTVLYSH
jgi:transmembrane regulatory protein ToxS